MAGACWLDVADFHRQSIDKVLTSFPRALTMFTKPSKHPSTAMDTLGQRLRELRERERLTVRQFADRIQKTPGYVSRIETRGEIPSPELLCAIADVYGIKAEELLELAKHCYLGRTQREIEAKNVSALALYRKENKK